MSDLSVIDRPRFVIVIPEATPQPSVTHFWSPVPLVDGVGVAPAPIVIPTTRIFQAFASHAARIGELPTAQWVRLQADHYFPNDEIHLHFGFADSDINHGGHSFEYPAECRGPGLSRSHILDQCFLLGLCAEVMTSMGKEALAGRMTEIANTYYLPSEFEATDAPEGVETVSLTEFRYLTGTDAERAMTLVREPIPGSFDIDPMLTETPWSKTDGTAHPYRAFPVPARALYPEDFDDEFDDPQDVDEAEQCVVVGKGHVFTASLWQDLDSQV